MSKQVACPKHGIVDAPCYECAKEFAAQFPRVVPSPADPIAAEAREMVEQYSLAGMRPWLSVPERRLLEREITAFGHRMKSADRAEASTWRPISEVQPRDVVLVWDNGTLSRDPGVKVWRAGSQKITTPGITHWMPLPTPPEGGER